MKVDELPHKWWQFLSHVEISPTRRKSTNFQLNTYSNSNVNLEHIYTNLVDQQPTQ